MKRFRYFQFPLAPDGDYYNGSGHVGEVNTFLDSHHVTSVQSQMMLAGRAGAVLVTVIEYDDYSDKWAEEVEPGLQGPSPP